MSSQQEQFSLSFVQMVATAAGFWIKHHTTDYDGVDITIASSKDYDRYWAPEFEIQLKCTAQRDRLLQAEAMTWSLGQERFRKLVNPKRYNVALIGVLLVPKDLEQVLDADEDRLISASCMYWEYASRLGDLPEGQASKTLHLPRANVFNVPAVQGIMRSIGEGGIGR